MVVPGWVNELKFAPVATPILNCPYANVEKKRTMNSNECFKIFKIIIIVLLRIVKILPVRATIYPGQIQETILISKDFVSHL
jgi:hypothetical protein